jgi:hypothetical protein
MSAKEAIHQNIQPLRKVSKRNKKSKMEKGNLDIGINREKMKRRRKIQRPNLLLNMVQTTTSQSSKKP